MEALRQIEKLIQEGYLGRARKELNRFRTVKLKYSEILPIARTARRIGLPELAIHLLNPIVRPPTKTIQTATDEEKAIYAASLSRIGATTEAVEILTKLDADSLPECLLYQTYALVSEWNYRATIPLLLRFLKSKKINDDQRLIGEVNLAAAYVNERQSGNAEYLLSRLKDQTKELNKIQLYGNTLELLAQHAVFQSCWREAKTLLNEAEQVLTPVEGLDSFFVKKWKAIAHLLRTKEKGALAKVRKKATSLKHWETIRDCDRFECLAKHDRNLYTHLFFGTPFPEFCDRLRSDFGEKVDISSSYVWCPKGPYKSSPMKLPVKEGHLIDRLMGALTADFYRPVRLATLYARLYPNEHFNPRSAPDKIHQALKRLRNEFYRCKIPLEIREASGAYSLAALSKTAICVKKQSYNTNHLSFLLEKLKLQFEKKPFALPEAIECLRISRRSTSRALSHCVRNGSLVRTGKASKTKYRF